jgi:predicted PurR-regulated permease PerM
MPFSLDQFYQLNRRALIWAALLGLLWLLRDLFELVFLTFVLAFVALPVARAGQRWLRMSYRVSLVATYLVLLTALVSFVTFVSPQVIREANTLLGKLGDIERTLVDLKADFLERYPSLQRPFAGYMRSALDEASLARVETQLSGEAQAMGVAPAVRLPERGADEEPPSDAQRRYHRLEEDLLLRSLLNQQQERLREHVPRAINLLYRATVTTLLALLFSFLVLIDIERLRQQIRSLHSSRLHDFYEEAAQPVVRFAYIVGRAIQAQAVIALVNTSLTALGLVALGIPSLTMLSLVVFVCSFIPVLGVFISTTPIVLVALNLGGLGKALAVVVLITLVHMVEAYLLNPLIYGRHLNLNPVLVLFILLVGYHGFGVWGMVLGVPVSLYLLHDVLGVPMWPQRAPAR